MQERRRSAALQGASNVKTCSNYLVTSERINYRFHTACRGRTDGPGTVSSNTLVTMLERIIPYMRCPRCAHTDLRAAGDSLICVACGARYPFRSGILDMLGEGVREVVTPFQRLMQAPPIVSIYERIWRRLGYRIASFRSFGKEIRTVLRLNDGRQCCRVLELACGTGVFTRPIARNVEGLVVGLDLSWPMLRQARRLLERDGLTNVVLMRGSAFRLPFVSGAFPFVNCCGALHLFDQPEAALREIGRVVEQGGHLCVQTTIRPAHSGGLAWFLERFIRFGFFDENELREKLRGFGFEILESERHRISFTFLARRSTFPG